MVLRYTFHAFEDSWRGGNSSIFAKSFIGSNQRNSCKFVGREGRWTPKLCVFAIRLVLFAIRLVIVVKLAWQTGKTCTLLEIMFAWWWNSHGRRAKRVLCLKSRCFLCVQQTTSKPTPGIDVLPHGVCVSSRGVHQETLISLSCLFVRLFVVQRAAKSMVATTRGLRVQVCSSRSLTTVWKPKIKP